jgi:hypothetical protein
MIYNREVKQRQHRELSELLNWIGFPDGPPATVTLRQLKAAAAESERFRSARAWIGRVNSTKIRCRLERQGYTRPRHRLPRTKVFLHRDPLQ